jgi:hypothetical protein
MPRIMKFIFFGLLLRVLWIITDYVRPLLDKVLVHIN